jgi:hypothetical protein
MVVATIAALGALAVPVAVDAAPGASVIGESNKAPNQYFDIVVAIPKGADDAARFGNADFGLDVTLTYVDSNFNVDTLDSGRLSIKNDTMFLAPVDNQTDAVTFQLSFAGNPGPAANPNYIPTAELLHPGGP